MAEKARKGGLGRGLGALIPSGPGAAAGSKQRPTLGDSAADIIFGTSTPRPGALRPAAQQRRSVAGAPTFGREVTNPPRRHPLPVPEPAPASVSADAAPSSDPADYGATYEEIAISAIRPNAKNPRSVFDDNDLSELVHSIREFGLLQPIVVRPASDGDGYELIMGERRWRAAAAAGLIRIPAIVRAASDETMLRDALLENIHRVQLNPLEEAAAYQQLLEEFGVTQAELADRLGRSRPVITNTIRLLQLPVGVQKRVAVGVLSAGHARALLGVKVPDTAAAQAQLAERIVAEGLSVRATEEQVSLLNRDGAPEPPKKRQPRPQPEFATAAAERLADVWDTKVSVTMGKRKGKIVVEFGDQEDLARIMELIQGQTD